MNRLNEQESSEKKVKNIALKYSTKKSENENLNLLVKSFGKYLKRKGNKDNEKRYNSKCNDSKQHS